jgi:Ser/Thr protein kinase RdoA (MazF antagonist)
MHESFSSLNHRAQVGRMTELARIALAAYPLSGLRLRLQAHRWNTTFRVVAPGGDQYLLRIPRASQISLEAARSELLWLDALRKETTLQVPEPVPNKEQSLLTVATCPGVPEPRFCVLFRWIEGRFLHKGLTPSHLFQVGELMARLQDHAAQWQPPIGFTRSRVDNLGALERGPADAFDPAVAERAVQSVAAVSTPAAAAVVASAIRKVWTAMEGLGEGPEVFGLMHADLHHRNFLFHRGIAAAIDFEDCGYGHWLYDFAVPLTALRRHPDYRALRQALLMGYRQRRPLAAEHERLIDTLMALRTLQDLLGAIEVKDQATFQGEWEMNLAGALQELRAFIDR